MTGTFERFLQNNKLSEAQINAVKAIEAYLKSPEGMHGEFSAPYDFSRKRTVSEATMRNLSKKGLIELVESRTYQISSDRSYAKRYRVQGIYKVTMK